MSELTKEQIFDAARNEHHKTFKLGDREFPIKDLDYDSYLEFLELTHPILQVVIGSLEVVSNNGDPDVSFNPAGFDVQKMIQLAGKSLPRMVWLCCKQTDPKITVEDVKRLARRPQAMIQIVIEQVRHNQMIKEFADFFKQASQSLRALAPEVKEVATPLSLTGPTA